MKKSLDKAIEDYDKAKLNEVTYISRLEKENATLKKSLSKAGELIEELKQENFNLKDELETADDILTIQREEIEISRLPLNERLEQEYITRREQEDLSKEINRECKQEKGKEIEHG